MKLINNLVAIAIILLLCISAASEKNMVSSENHGLNIMFYNVENLFDTIDSKLDDDEFLPSSERNWDSYKYHGKLKNIYKVILLCSKSDHSPDIVGLCEVENINTLNDLISTTYLRDQGYEPVISKGFDSRGINTALLYKKKKLDLEHAESWCPLLPDGSFLTTRAVLYCRFKVAEDVLHTVICHWPSRRGGVISSQSRRLLVSDFLRTRIDSLGCTEKIIIMGDFNDEPDSESMKRLSNNSNICEDSLMVLFPSDNEISGTYKYQGTWYQFDNVVMSPSLYYSKSHLCFKHGSLDIMDSEVLMTEDNSYKGFRPLRTWWGYSYEGGYSDHLPMVFSLAYSN